MNQMVKEKIDLVKKDTVRKCMDRTWTVPVSIKKF